MKNNLTESDINRIVNRVINEDLQESTWEGVKGWFRGKGYYYSKYLAELEDTLESLREKIQNDRRINEKLESVKTKVESSDMEEFRKKDLNNTIIRIQRILTHTDSVINRELYNIYRMKN
jgi:hypothetical protein